MGDPVPTLPNWSCAPNGGWDYRIPELDGDIAYVGPVTDYNTLEEQIKARLKANDIAIPGDIPQRVQAYICARVPGYCTDGAGGQPVGGVGVHLGIKNVIAGTWTILNWVASGRKNVDHAVAEERAAICVRCPYNQHPEGCTACNLPALMNLVNRIVKGKPTKHDASLQACTVCVCSLKAKVHVPHDVLIKNMSNRQIERLPDFCWLVQRTPSDKGA